MTAKTRGGSMTTTRANQPDDKNKTDTPTPEEGATGVEVPNSVSSEVKITVDESIAHLFTGEDPPSDEEANATGANPIVTTNSIDSGDSGTKSDAN